MRAFFLGVLVFWGASVLSAQTTPTATPPAPVPTTPAPVPAAPVIPAALPYTEQEFPPWVLKVRRAEIVTVGAFPLAYLFAALAYDYTYYLSSGFPSTNTPWPVGPGTSQWTTTSQPQQLQNKNLTLVASAVAASLVVAGLDWLLGL